MPCNKCGAAVTETKSTPFQGGSGPFVERYECANGHVGYISGDESDPPGQWTKTGAIYD